MIFKLTDHWVAECGAMYSYPGLANLVFFTLSLHAFLSLFISSSRIVYYPYSQMYPLQHLVAVHIVYFCVVGRLPEVQSIVWGLYPPLSKHFKGCSSA